MDIGLIIGQVVVLFVLILVGAVARKTGILPDAGLGTMTSLTLYVALPCTILISFQSPFSKELLWEMGQAAIWSFGLHITMWLVGKKIFNRFALDQRKAMQFAAIFSNAGFMGYPILLAIFGNTGLLIGAIYVSMFNIFLWTAGMSIFMHQSDWRKTIIPVISNPGIIATVLGIITFIFSIKIPTIPLKSVTMLGSMTTPLSMLVVGARLIGVRFREALSGVGVYIICALRLLIIPLVLFFLMKLCGVSLLPLGVLTIQAAMPVAANTTLFAEKFGGDSKFASRLIFLSTFLSIATIPLIMLLVL